MTANEQTKLMPGDVVEVRLRLEGLPKFTDSGPPAGSGSPAARDEGQAVGARK